MKQLQGTWNIASTEIDGSAMPAGGSIVIKGDRFQTLGMEVTYEGTIKVGTKKKPHTIDMLFTKGPEKGKGNTNLGIFAVNGDSWRLCVNMTGKARPKAFSTQEGGGLALQTLTRGTAVKPNAAQKQPAETALKLVPASELEGEWQMLALVTSAQPLDGKWLQYGKRVARANQVTVTMA